MTTVIDDLNVSRETRERLDAYAKLLVKWTKSINLIAPSTIDDVWDRHIEDSAQVYQFAPQGWKTWLDLGTGGGLPGLVICILDNARGSVTLVESDARKCVFLQTVARELDLNVNIMQSRIEDVGTHSAEIVSARALAPLSHLLKLSSPLMAPDGFALFPKGKNAKEELEEAKKNWHFNLDVMQSKTSSDSSLLCISRIHARESHPNH